MVIGIALILLYALMVGVLIFKYDHPSPRRGKISGRGGDFAE
jgi:hypothetical protein